MLFAQVLIIQYSRFLEKRKDLTSTYNSSDNVLPTEHFLYYGWLKECRTEHSHFCQTTNYDKEKKI